MKDTKDISRSYEKLLSNIRDYNARVDNLINEFAENEKRYKEVVVDDNKRAEVLSERWELMIEKIRELEQFEAENFINESINEQISLTENIYNINENKNNKIQNDDNKFDNLPVNTEYISLNKLDTIKEEYNNQLGTFKIRRNTNQNIKVINFILSYEQYNNENEINSDNENIIRKYYKGTIITQDINEKIPQIKAFLTIPDLEISGFENKSIGPEFEFIFTYDDLYIYINLVHKKIFRFDWVNETNENFELLDMLSPDYNKTSKIRYSIKAALYSVDEDNFEKINEYYGPNEIPYSKITLKPIENGFYKYINFDTNNTNIEKKQNNTKYSFSSHSIKNIEESIKYFDIKSLFDYIKNDFCTIMDKEDNTSIIINDVLTEKDFVYFATNKGLYVYFRNENKYANISKNWYTRRTVNDETIDENFNYLCIGKDNTGVYYTYTKESGIIRLNKNIINYIINDEIPNDIKTVPSNSVESLLDVDDQIKEIKFYDNKFYFLTNKKLFTIDVTNNENNIFMDFENDFQMTPDFLSNTKNCLRISNNGTIFVIDFVNGFIFSNEFRNNTDIFFIDTDVVDFIDFEENKEIIIYKVKSEVNVIRYVELEKYQGEVTSGNSKVLDMNYGNYTFDFENVENLDFISFNNDLFSVINSGNEIKIINFYKDKSLNEYILNFKNVKNIEIANKNINTEYYKNNNILINKDISLIKFDKINFRKSNNIENIRNEIKNIINKNIEIRGKYNKEYNIPYKLIIHSKNENENSFNGIYKELGILNNKDEEFEIIINNNGTFLKEKDRDDIIYWANNRDNIEKVGNKKNRYENIRFEFLNNDNLLKNNENTNLIDTNFIPLASPNDNSSTYKYNKSIKSTGFYNNTIGIKIVSLTETCSKISFRYRINSSYNSIYFYIDGKYYNRYYISTRDIWYSSGDINVEHGEHEFTWVLYNEGDNETCIDEIAIDDIVITDYSKFSNNYNHELINNNSYKYNSSIESTPFYNSVSGIKIVSLIETCSKISFRYKSYDSKNYIYFYIDGKFINKYNNNIWSSINITIDQSEHEFIWVLYSIDFPSCIDEIAIDDAIITDYGKFNNKYTLSSLAPIPNDNNFEFKYNSSIESTPFYNPTSEIKIISLVETCSKISFRYKTYNINNSIYLYIDGKYYSNYSSSDSWYFADITVERGEHEFTWVLSRTDSSYYIGIDQITIDDEIITDYSKFNNNSIHELIYRDIDNNYKYDPSIESTPFYNSIDGVKIISLVETCSKISFRYKTYNSNNSSGYNCIYLYIDGKYYDRYISNDWSLFDNISIDLKYDNHNFTWVLYNYNNRYGYACIDEIAINDVIITDYSKFSNNSNYELNNNSIYKYDLSIESTPFYNDKSGIKIITLTETCSKLSFKYKIFSDNNNVNNSNKYIYLYIDGKYYDRYNSNNYNYWYSININITVNQNNEHEFTWILCNNINENYIMCIDEIAIDDEIITDYSKFSNTNNHILPLASIPDNKVSNDYKYNPSIESTPFYINIVGIKIISFTETCSKMSFRYKGSYNTEDIYIYLYIDGQYYRYYKYFSSSWSSSGDITVDQGEHEFTWLICSKALSSYYVCIDEIAIDDEIITNYNKFSNTNNHTLQLASIPDNNNSNYKNNSSIVSTPFYNDTIGIKIVSLTETCSKISFKRRCYYCDIYLYIDGEYYSNYSGYSSSNWYFINIDVEQGEHEFTWLLCNSEGSGFYACIDEIAIDDEIITNYDKFSNNCTIRNLYKYNPSIESTPFYNDKSGIKIISLTETCSKMSFRYKTYSYSSGYNKYIFLYIDGKYYKEYKNYYNNNWSSSGDINVEQGEHEFTWILCIDKYESNSSYYIGIDEIVIDDEIVTNYDNFTNNSNYELNTLYKYNPSIDSTPFYNATSSIKIVSLTETCSKISFRYKTDMNSNKYNDIYLYIDGQYYNKYNSNNIWSSSGDITVEQGEHEFIWILCSSEINYPVYIDEIIIDDEMITDYNKFSNTNNHALPLASIPDNDDNSNYKYDLSIDSTPFYNDTIGFKVVTLTETCNMMSFRYKTYSNDNILRGRIYLYIDGQYYNKYNSNTNNNIWSSTSITVEKGEHEFTWILFNTSDNNDCHVCIDEISFYNYIIDYNKFNNNTLNNNIVEEDYKIINNTIKGKFDGLITNLNYSENFIPFEYKKNINNIKNIFTNKNRTYLLSDDKLWCSFDKNIINKLDIKNNNVGFSKNLNLEKSYYLNEISTIISPSNIKDIKLSTACTFILTNDNVLYACGNNYDNELPNIEKDKEVYEFVKISNNVTNIWVYENSNIIEITKNNIKEYYLSGKNIHNKYKTNDLYVNFVKDEELSNMQNIKDIKINNNNIFVITEDNILYYRGMIRKNDNGVLEELFNTNKNIIDVKYQESYTLLHCRDQNDEKDYYYYLGSYGNSYKNDFTEIRFNSESDITHNVFLFDQDYITYYTDENEVMYISNSFDKTVKYEIEHFVEKVEKANDEYYLLMNSCIYKYKPLNNQLIKIIDKAYDFFVFNNSILRILRTDMTYGTLFLDNYDFNEDYGYGAGVYIGKEIKRENIRQIIYDEKSYYMEAYYGFNYNKLNENKIVSFIYDLNKNRNIKKISRMKENSDIFGIKKRRNISKIMEGLESLDSLDNPKMYTIDFEILPIVPKQLTDSVFVKDIYSDDEEKIRAILK